MQQAFHTQIHNFTFNGASHRSNTGDPAGNDSGIGLIAAVTGMDDLGFEPAFVMPTEPDGAPAAMIPLGTNPDGRFFESQCFTGVQTVTFPKNATASTVPQATYTGSVYGAPITNTQLGHLPSCGHQPSEVRTAYNMTPPYTRGLDGSGETVVIVDACGSDTIEQDAALFSQVYHLPAIGPGNFQIVKAPGLEKLSHRNVSGRGVGARLAPGAKIALLVATDHGSLDEAINYAVVDPYDGGWLGQRNRRWHAQRAGVR